MSATSVRSALFTIRKCDVLENLGRAFSIEIFMLVLNHKAFAQTKGREADRRTKTNAVVVNFMYSYIYLFFVTYTHTGNTIFSSFYNDFFL